MSAHPKMIAVQGGTLLFKDRSLTDGTLIIQDDRIIYAGHQIPSPPVAMTIDAAGLYISPGLIELHIHGVESFSTEDHVEGIAKSLLGNGITHFLPTMMCAENKISKIAVKISSIKEGAKPIGFYLEGPFVNRQKKGGILDPYISEWNEDYLDHIIELTDGKLKLMTVAPEIIYGTTAVKDLRDRNILVALGHSNCSFEEAEWAFNEGASIVTHLFNAQSGIDHKKPGLALYGLLNDDIYIEINPDGTHVAKEVLQLVDRIKPQKRTVIISDSAVGSNLPDGEYNYMNKAIVTNSKAVYYKENETLIGARSTINRQIKQLSTLLSRELYEIVAQASAFPAEFLGISHAGSIAEGNEATIVLFDETFTEAKLVIQEGKITLDRLSKE